MSIHYRVAGDQVVIVGHTYPHRSQIKAMGARFDGSQKVWCLPHSDENLALVAQLCSSLGGGALTNQDAVTSSDRPLQQPTTSPKPVAKGFSVSELADKIHLTMSEAFPSAVWVMGEVQNLAPRKSGWFFDLAEAKSKGQGTIALKTIAWNQTLRFLQQRAGKSPLDQIICEGMQVRVLCQVQYYRDRGQTSLQVMDIDPAFTKGALALAREELMRELRAKGLDRKNKSLTLSPFPFHIGLISAPGSRAKSDFLDQLATYEFGGRVSFCAAQMQGESTPEQVSTAVAKLDSHGCDLIVMTRGGGSAADLRWFDHKQVALAIAHSGVPVVAAIGHHDDVCIAEDICYHREKTPTAAADFIVARLRSTADGLEELVSRLSSTVQRSLDRHNQEVSQCAQALQLYSQQYLQAKERRLQSIASQLAQRVVSQVHSAQRTIDAVGTRLGQAAERYLADRNLELRELESALQKKDPQPWLAKGWTQLYGPSGRVTSIDSIQLSDTVYARLRDGRIELEVTKKEEYPDEKA